VTFGFATGGFGEAIVLSSSVPPMFEKA